MKINERVSSERLDTIKSWRETYGQDANVMIPASEAESIISELQQYRAAAEPVVSDSMALAFHAAITDSAAGADDIEEIKTGLRAALANYAAPQVTSVPDGIEAAARWVDAQREAYDDEHGRYDPDTGTFEFGNDAQLEYSATLAEIAEGIRALRPTAAPAVQAEQLSGNAEQVSQPYTLREGLAAIRNLGPIDAEKIQAERDALNEPDVPDGYALVPIEPTKEMMLHKSGCQRHAWDDADCPMRQTRRLVWGRMIEAVPKQEAQEVKK